MAHLMRCLIPTSRSIGEIWTPHQFVLDGFNVRVRNFQDPGGLSVLLM
jgi:hypothetical protein